MINFREVKPIEDKPLPSYNTLTIKIPGFVTKPSDPFVPGKPINGFAQLVRDLFGTQTSKTGITFAGEFSKKYQPTKEQFISGKLPIDTVEKDLKDPESSLSQLQSYLEKQLTPEGVKMVFKYHDQMRMAPYLSELLAIESLVYKEAGIKIYRNTAFKIDYSFKDEIFTVRGVGGEFLAQKEYENGNVDQFFLFDPAKTAMGFEHTLSLTDAGKYEEHYQLVTNDPNLAMLFARAYMDRISKGEVKPTDQEKIALTQFIISTMSQMPNEKKNEIFQLITKDPINALLCVRAYLDSVKKGDITPSLAEQAEFIRFATQAQMVGYDSRITTMDRKIGELERKNSSSKIFNFFKEDSTEELKLLEDKRETFMNLKSTLELLSNLVGTDPSKAKEAMDQFSVLPADFLPHVCFFVGLRAQTKELLDRVSDLKGTGKYPAAEKKLEFIEKNLKRFMEKSGESAENNAQAAEEFKAALDKGAFLGKKAEVITKNIGDLALLSKDVEKIESKAKPGNKTGF